MAYSRSSEQRVLAWYAEHPKTTSKEAGEALGLNPASVRRILAQYRRQIAAKAGEEEGATTKDELVLTQLVEMGRYDLLHVCSCGDVHLPGKRVEEVKPLKL